MNVDTGAFQNLAAQVAEMAERLAELAVRDVAVEHMFAAGYEAGQSAARSSLLGRAAETSAPARLRPAHLRLVQDERRSS